MQNTYKSDLSESASKPFLKVAILECEKSKVYSIFWICAWVVLQKKV